MNDDNNGYQVIQTSTVYRGKVFDIAEKTIQTPYNTIVHDAVMHGGAAAIVPVLGDGRIVMVRQYRCAIEGLLLEIPAGKLERGEDPRDCAIRELEEETGYIAQTMEFLTSYYPVAGYSSERIHIYVASDLAMGKQNLDQDEHVTIERYTMEEAMRMVYSGTIMDSKTIIGLMLYEKKYASLGTK